MLSLADRPSLEAAWGAEPLTGAAEGIVAGVECQWGAEVEKKSLVRAECQCDGAGQKQWRTQRRSWAEGRSDVRTVVWAPKK